MSWGMPLAFSIIIVALICGSSFQCYWDGVKVGRAKSLGWRLNESTHTILFGPETWDKVNQIELTVSDYEKIKAALGNDKQKQPGS